MFDWNLVQNDMFYEYGGSTKSFYLKDIRGKHKEQLEQFWNQWACILRVSPMTGNVTNHVQHWGDERDRESAC
jgi:hypothetical protein